MQLVMNYLVVEGYKDAAAVFEEESGEHPNTPLESVASRMKVRQALQQGDVTKAMEVKSPLLSRLPYPTQSITRFRSYILPVISICCIYLSFSPSLSLSISVSLSLSLSLSLALLSPTQGPLVHCHLDHGVY